MSAIETRDPHPVQGDRAVAAIRAWVALYTKGLPAQIASDRQTLIEADLYDEGAAQWLGETSGLARQRWSRWLRGAPADVNWRLEQQRRITTMPRRTDMRISKVQLAAIGVVTIWYAVIIIGGLVVSPSFREWAGMGLALFGLGMSIVGLLLAIPKARAGFVVGIIGTALAFLSMPWMFPFFLPLPIVLGYRLLREQGTAHMSAPGT